MNRTKTWNYNSLSNRLNQTRDDLSFSTGQWRNTPPGCVRAISPRRGMKCCIKWPGLHKHPTSTQLRWLGMSWTAEWWKSRQQVLIIWGNSFQTVGKAFQVKLVERMPRVCKAVIKAKGGYLKILKSKIYFELFNPFLVTTWFHMCYFIVLMSSLFSYNVENSKNKEKPLN